MGLRFLGRNDTRLITAEETCWVNRRLAATGRTETADLLIFTIKLHCREGDETIARARVMDRQEKQIRVKADMGISQRSDPSITHACRQMHPN